jgi:hypothetical protein
MFHLMPILDNAIFFLFLNKDKGFKFSKHAEKQLIFNILTAPSNPNLTKERSYGKIRLHRKAGGHPRVMIVPNGPRSAPSQAQQYDNYFNALRSLTGPKWVNENLHVQTKAMATMRLRGQPPPKQELSIRPIFLT